MRRRLWREFRLSHDTSRLALVLGLLGYSGAARIADAAAPVFQGTITSPTLCSPRGLALTSGGDLLVGSDCMALHHMEQFNVAGELIGTWVFPGPGPRGTYGGPPNGVAVDGSGNVFVTDMEVSRILKYTSSGGLISNWVVHGSVPVDVAVDGFGDVYVAEMAFNQVRKTTPGGALLATFGGPGSTPGRFQSLNGLAVDASGRVYGTDYLRMRVVRFLSDGTFDMEFATPSPPEDVAVGPEGNIYVLGSESSQVYQYTPGGVLLQSFGSPAALDLPYRIIIDTTGMIFITEQRANRVSKFQIDLVTPAAQLTFGRLKAMYR